MPVYRITTDQGAFNVTTNAPASQEELLKALAEQGIGYDPNISLGPSQAETSTILPPQVPPDVSKRRLQATTKAVGMLAGSLLVPQATVPAGAGMLARLGLGALNLGSRMAGAGAGSATGDVVGQTLTWDFDPEEGMQRYWDDFKQGAASEAVGTTVALPVNFVVGKLGGAAYRAAIKRTSGGKAVEEAVEGAAVAAGKKHFDKIPGLLGGRDAPIPAPNTLRAVDDYLIDPQTGAWNQTARELFGSEKGAKGAAEGAVAAGTPRIGRTTAWEVTPRDPATFQLNPSYFEAKSPGPDWSAWYLVGRDGKAQLFFRNDKVNTYRVIGTKGTPKDFGAEEDVIRNLSAQRTGQPIGVVPADTYQQGGKYVTRGQLFDVTRRDDAMTWADLNLFSSRFRNRDFSQVSDNAREAITALRAAVENDVRTLGPKVAKAWDKAWGAYRFARDPAGAIAKRAGPYVKGAGALTFQAVQEMFQRSHPRTR